ncbi:hypothetical protein STEG23_002766, partial [Scotinomys teguina]
QFSRLPLRYHQRIKKVVGHASLESADKKDNIPTGKCEQQEDHLKDCMDLLLQRVIRQVQQIGLVHDKA